MDLQLEDRIALITGSSKGIGQGVARGLANEGAIVIVHGRDKSKAEAVAHDIATSGGKVHVALGDLTNEDAVAAMVRKMTVDVGSIDILINNAGGSASPETWETTKAETWAGVFDKNVVAAARLTSMVLPAMKANLWGRIVNISSLAALMPPANRPDYSAAKAAMIAMTASLAKDCAKDGVTVNTVSPGTIHSETLDNAFRRAATEKGLATDAPWGDVEKLALPMFAHVPMGRVGTLEEIADAVAFLVSPRAAYITGANLRIDGGIWPGL